MAELSPMMRQYLEIKQQNPGALLFFRLGDFYELFFEDAKTVSKELDLVLTGRDCGLEERAPMCGVPFHSYESYVARLVKRGYKIAICEQMEDPALAKGLVRREVIRVITPGTITEGYMLDEGRHNYICVVNMTPAACALCFADISTGDVCITRLPSNAPFDHISAEISRFSPSEILLNEQAAKNEAICAFLKQCAAESVDTRDDCEFDLNDARELVSAQFPAQEISRADLESEENEPVICAIGALIKYLNSTQMSGVQNLCTISFYEGEQFMRLDTFTRNNLELCETMRSREKKGSLLHVLDKAKTPMGKRLLRSWFERPLISAAAIHARLNAVDELLCNSILRSDIIESLSHINDLERLNTRVVCSSANARELRALGDAVRALPELKMLVEGLKSPMLRQVFCDIDTLDDLLELIDRAIVDEPPATVRDGGMIREGFSAEIDALNYDMSGGKGILADVEARERERTGIAKLKIGYNRVFGYYIEVSNANRALVPEDYIRKQTLTNCERYITQELKEIENRVLGARERLLKLEYETYMQVLSQAAERSTRIQKTAAAIARLDVLCSFAYVAERNNYCMPSVNTSGRIILKSSRHPVVESILEGAFVPNDVLLDKKDNRVSIITGPNMAGKSTFMRQTALIVFMAQIGSFVPAESAEIGIVDAIYTRVGASDDLAAGQSTFMVEMSEVAHILREATSDSLLILDEIGRGTSTFDGMSIARAVLEYVADKRHLGAKALFATHYHELTVLEDIIDGVVNYNIAVKKHGDDITFLRRIVRGGADDSYGIEVAKLAGIPDRVIKRAKEVLAQLEAGQPEKITHKKKDTAQLEFSFTPPGEQEAVDRLRQINIDSLTPLEALQVLDQLSKLVK